MKGGANAGGAALTGTLTASLDFKPEVNGFSFENYGKSPYPNLTAAQVQRFFGDQVCASNAGGTCTLTPPAQQWMEEANKAMDGGHCEGMAVLALLMQKGQIKASDFGADQAFGLKIEGNDKLAQEIAYWFATQALNPSASAEIKDLTPTQIVDKLKESFAPGAAESYTVGIFKTIDGAKKEGHAITPYGVADAGDGKVQIAVYDNNFPGQARAIIVDTAANTWTYSTTTNPSEPVGAYEGNASTFSLTLTPTSSRKDFVCPVCGGGGAAGNASKGAAPGGGGGSSAPASYNTMFLGQYPGVDELVVSISGPDGAPLSGVTTVDQKNADVGEEDGLPAVYQIPSTTPFTVKLDGSKLTKETQTDLTVVGPGYDLYVDGIKVVPQQVDVVTFDPANRTVTYQTTAGETPAIGAGFASSGADYAFAAGGVSMSGGGTIELGFDEATGKLSVKNAGTAPGTFALAVDRFDDAGEQEFTHPGVDLPAGSAVVVDYSDWTANGQQIKAQVESPGSAPEAIEISDQ